MSLCDQASILFCAVSGCSQTATHRLLNTGKTCISDLHDRLYQARTKYVVWKERTIKFGQGQEWKDVEADEVDLGKGDDPTAKPSSKKPIVWEQWGGIVERGNPETLVLCKLKPAKTKRRAPGPGPIRKRDWRPLARRWLHGRRVILHTDGAKTYLMKIDGVKHDWVVHSRKRMVINGRSIWVKPKFSKVRWHNIAPYGAPKKKLWVKCGTQIIDRAWGMLRKHKGSLGTGPNSLALKRRIRSFQWEYWQRGKDLWAATGDMLQSLHERRI
jgi:hypothetical protein